MDPVRKYLSVPGRTLLTSTTDSQQQKDVDGQVRSFRADVAELILDVFIPPEHSL